MGAFIPALAPAIIDSDWGFCYSAFGNYYLIFWKGNSVGRLLLLNNPFSKVLPHFSVLKWSPVLESKRAIGFFLFKCYKIRNFAEEPSRSPYYPVIRKPIGNYVGCKKSYQCKAGLRPAKRLWAWHSFDFLWIVIKPINGGFRSGIPVSILTESWFLEAVLPQLSGLEWSPV